jgi:integrase
MAAFYGPRSDGSHGLIRESMKTEDEELARKRLDARLRQVANHRDGIAAFDGPAARRVTVGQLFDRLLDSYRLRGIKGLAVTETRLGPDSPLRLAFAALKAVAVTADRIERYREARLKAGRANATVNREIELLRSAFGLGRKRKLVSATSMPDFPEKLPERRRTGEWSIEQLERLLPYLPEPLGEVARFAYATGWRASEILGLTWDRVDRRRGTIRLEDSKNGEPRFLPLDDELAALIERRWQDRRTVNRDGSEGIAERVFHRNGLPVSDSWRKTAFVAACRKAKLRPEKGPGLVFHQFRNTAVSNMHNAGVPLYVSMKVTGHKTDSMHRRYYQGGAEAMREALAKTRAYVAEHREKSNVEPIRKK